ncbi:regulatory TetR family protein [Mumia flava]|uniref:Regulatory TetR family protein n=1 Tax=Mumia flava TaxID=1348852 RepID=A0A2M9BG84_9ACTN|nr:TetR/AcrR family transcriptional regulator C-terminal domain-containing protein [Mumia flava]PJJ56955.1 regulatory TetR family protein [Mumia flava]
MDPDAAATPDGRGASAAPPPDGGGASATSDRDPAPAHRFVPLWESPEPSRRGRPARVTRGEIVDAAVAIADADGLDAVSMRSVARALDVGTMTLYSHVPGRVELVDAMVDRAYADFTLPDPDLAWRPALEQYARSSWTMLRSHPWLLDLNSWRYPLAPHVFDAEEAGYRILIDTGLSPTQVVETIAVINSTVVGFARSAAAEDADQRADGTDYQAYWEGTTAFWEHTFDPSRYPSITRLWTTGVFESAATPFELRIGSLLDTVALLIERAQAEGGTDIPAFDVCMERLEGDGEAPS